MNSNQNKQELTSQYQYYKSQLDQIKNQLIQIQTFIREIESSIDSLEALKTSNAEMIELTNGVLLPVKQKIENAIVEIGAGVLSQMPLSLAVEVQKAKLERFQKNKTALEHTYMQIESQLNTTAMQLQGADA